MFSDINSSQSGFNVSSQIRQVQSIVEKLSVVVEKNTEASNGQISRRELMRLENQYQPTSNHGVDDVYESDRQALILKWVSTGLGHAFSEWSLLTAQWNGPVYNIIGWTFAWIQPMPYVMLFFLAHECNSSHLWCALISMLCVLVPPSPSNREQDEDLDDLSATVERLGDVGLSIHEELSVQVLLPLPKSFDFTP